MAKNNHKLTLPSFAREILHGQEVRLEANFSEKFAIWLAKLKHEQ